MGPFSFLSKTPFCIGLIYLNPSLGRSTIFGRIDHFGSIRPFWVDRPLKLPFWLVYMFDPIDHFWVDRMYQNGRCGTPTFEDNAQRKTFFGRILQWTYNSLWSYWVLKFYEGYVIKKSGTRPLLQTLSRVNLNPISVPAQNDTNFPQSILGLYF